MSFLGHSVAFFEAWSAGFGKVQTLLLLTFFMLNLSLSLGPCAALLFAAEPRVAPHVYAPPGELRGQNLQDERKIRVEGQDQIRESSRELSNPRGDGQVLLPSAHDSRTRRTQSRLADGSLPLPEEKPRVISPETPDWRLKIASAAIAHGDVVKLGEIAQPLGRLGNWVDLQEIDLWPAPPEPGKPMQINRSNLAQALNERLGRDIASRCILPTSLVLQKGGVLIREDDLRAYVVSSLTPILRTMPGEVEFTDFHLPEYIFLAHSGQKVQLEQPKMSAGRVGLRFAILEADGQLLRRASGSITITQWVTVPAAARSISKGEALTPEAVTFSRMNARRLKDAAWDGKGGPWQVLRSLAPGEPILQSDLATQLMVRRGEIVTLIYAKGNLHLQTQAEALSDGEPGARIAVRNLQSKKQVFATVTDNKTVVIH